MRLDVTDVTFAYGRGPELFGGLSHTFATGAMTALTGPSGRGKSTLLYVLGLLLRPTRGAVRLGGTEVGSLRDTARSRVRAHHLGFVFQDAALDSTRPVIDSVVEPALYAGVPRAVALPRARELLDAVGVTDRALHRPGQISGGQAQRVAVARALMNDPQVILADEPTGNLDRANARAILDLLASAATQDGAGERTVVIATHDPFVLDRCTEVVAL